MKHLRTAFSLVLILLLGLIPLAHSQSVDQPTQTFADVIDSTPRFSILKEALERTGVNVTLTQGGPYTAFAPTNAAFRRAFAKLGISGIDDIAQEQLTGLLLYHLVEGKILSDDLAPRQTVATLATPTLDIIKRQDRIVVRASFSRARVVRADIETTNGVIHVVNNVLLSIPVPEPPTAPTIAAIVQNDPQFSRLAEALQQTGLADNLSQEGPFTLFAPTNAAFDKLFAALEAQNIIVSPEQLTGLLLYHVVSGKILSEDLAPEQTVPTLATPTLDIFKNDSIITVKALFSEAQVTEKDIQASNGVVHAIDEVLLSIPGLIPEDTAEQNIVEIVGSRPEFSQLAALLQQTGLDQALQEAGPFTLFAPTNTAFAELFAVLDSQQISLPQEQLTGLLLYHVVEGKILAADLAPEQTVPTLASPTLDIRRRNGEITVEALFSTARVTEKDILASNGVIHAIDAVLISIPGIIPEEPEAPEPSINIFPNAFVDELNIDLRGFSPTTVKVEIFSLISNQVVFTQEVATSGTEVITLDVSALESQARPYVLLLSSGEFANIFLIQKE
jgi:transforming growth factor-beta-induced protein